PGTELRPQLLEVEVVLQRGLEVVRRYQVRQVVCFRRIGQVAQGDDPGFVLPALLADQGTEKPSSLDAADRCVDPLDLVGEQLERSPVTERGSAVQVHAGVRMR